MLNINALSDNDIVVNTKALVGEEDRIIQEVLKYLTLIEERRIYLKRGFDSLFAFCVKELKYDEGSASRRISSMRLIREVPQAFDKLKNNEVNLSTLNQLQVAFNREEKRTGEKIDPEVKLDLLSKITGKSQRGCEQELIKKFPEAVIPKEKERPLTEDLTELKLVVPKRLLDKLRKLKSLLAHKKSNASYIEVIEMMADMALKKLDLTADTTLVSVSKVIKTSKVTEATKISEASRVAKNSKIKAKIKTKSEETLKTETPSPSAHHAAGFRQYISKDLRRRVWINQIANANMSTNKRARNAYQPTLCKSTTSNLFILVALTLSII